MDLEEINPSGIDEGEKAIVLLGEEREQKIIKEGALVRLPCVTSQNIFNDQN